MADDDEDDCTLAKDAFRDSGARGEIKCVEDGVVRCVRVETPVRKERDDFNFFTWPLGW
jgi:hypothetical protein